MSQVLCGCSPFVCVLAQCWLAIVVSCDVSDWIGGCCFRLTGYGPYSYYCCRHVFTDPLPRNGLHHCCSIVACVCIAGIT
jgi:hypothetical protein